MVDEHLRLAQHQNVFVIGDLAASRTRLMGHSFPKLRRARFRVVKHAARMIMASIDGSQVKPFRYRDKGSMATIGRNAAVVELPNGVRVSGFVGWVAWLSLHLLMLIGFRNRANVLVNWAWNYLTYDRGSRLIIELDE